MQIRQITLIIASLLVTGTLVYILIPGDSPVDRDPSREAALHNLKERGSLYKDDSNSKSQGPFTEKTIDWAGIRKALPDNKMPLTKEESEAAQEEKIKRRALGAKIVSNRASDAEIDAYYREQSEIARDVIEVCEHILEKYDTKLDEKTYRKYSFLKEQFELRLERIPVKKEEAIKRIQEFRKKKGLTQ